MNPIHQCFLTFHEFIVVGLQRCSLLGHDANFWSPSPRSPSQTHVCKVQYFMQLASQVLDSQLDDWVVLSALPKCQNAPAFGRWQRGSNKSKVFLPSLKSPSKQQFPGQLLPLKLPPDSYLLPFENVIILRHWLEEERDIHGCLAQTSKLVEILSCCTKAKTSFSLGV